MANKTIHSVLSLFPTYPGFEGDRKGPHPTSTLPRPYNERTRYPIVVMVRAGVVGRMGGDPCGRPRPKKVESDNIGNGLVSGVGTLAVALALKCVRQGGFRHRQCKRNLRSLPWRAFRFDASAMSGDDGFDDREAEAAAAVRAGAGAVDAEEAVEDGGQVGGVDAGTAVLHRDIQPFRAPGVGF